MSASCIRRTVQFLDPGEFVFAALVCKSLRAAARSKTGAMGVGGTFFTPQRFALASPSTLEFSVENGFQHHTPDSCMLAAKYNYLETLQRLREQDPPCPWDENTCTIAAARGHLETLLWLRAQDPPCPWSQWTCGEAARTGHFEVLRWLRAQNPPCPWGLLICALAARGGRLEILQWLRAQDPPCPWLGEATCEEAAMCGHFEVLRWLRVQDPPCPWNYDVVCAWVSKGGNTEMLQWMRTQDPQQPCVWTQLRIMGLCHRTSRRRALEEAQRLAFGVEAADVYVG
jgi:hypothetical protein